MTPIHTVRILGMADQGMALARLEGKVLFVAGGAPGDLAEVAVVREKAGYGVAEIRRVLEPAPCRREPACPHFGLCGGCAWQHVDYPTQLQGKAASFAGFLSSRLGLGAEVFAPPIPSERPYGYRNRVAFQVTDGPAPGFARARSHDLFAVERCPVCDPAVENLLPPLSRTLASLRGAGVPSRVEFQKDGEDRLWGIVHGRSAPNAEIIRRWRSFAEENGLAGLYHDVSRRRWTLHGGADARMGFFSESGGKRLRLGATPGNFVQANFGVNRAISAWIESLRPLYEGSLVFDLFCGSGNFTLPLALAASRVVGVEGNGSAADDAERNVAENGLANVRVVRAPVGRALGMLAAEGLRPSFCLLDPPRAGSPEAVRALVDLAPPAVAYVSCSPPTLIRDLAVLAGGGYRVARARMADMFPQTAHAEGAVLLLRDGVAPKPFLTVPKEVRKMTHRPQ